jgi:nucleotide-binding universal stress UspA family protein
VLVATDFSAHSSRALHAAMGFGLLADAELTFLHAQEAPGARGIGLAHLPQDKAQAVTQAAAAEVRDALVRYVGGFALAQAPELLVEEGRPGAVILHAVERLRPDLVVLGTSGTGWLRQAIIGSVAAEILGQAGCDVLAVPPRDDIHGGD